jgi:hypothetical protein
MVKNLIKKILKEEFEDLSWIKDVPSGEKWFSGSRPRYMGRPARYRVNPTPMERLMIKLGLAVEAEEPVDGYYSYGLGRYISDEEASEVYHNSIGTNVRLKLKTVLLDAELREGKLLMVWLGNLRPKQRIELFQKLKRMGFKFKRNYNYNTKPNTTSYFIIINPNRGAVDTILIGDPGNVDNQSRKSTHRNEFERILNGGNAIAYDSNNFLNKL